MLVSKWNQDITVNSDNTATDPAGRIAYSFIVPGGAMGPNGSLQWELMASNNNVVQDAQIFLRVGATRVAAIGTLANGAIRMLANAGSIENTAVAVNRFYDNNSKGTATITTPTALTINTAADWQVDVIVAWGLAVTGGTVVVRKVRAWVEYGA